MDMEVTNKRHIGGLEAPRNSLELQMETSYGLYSAGDNLLYAHHMANEAYGKDYYFTEAPSKKLISGDISRKSNTRQNAPSVVARLMGVDMLPIDSQRAPNKNENCTGKLMDTKPSKKGSVGHILSTSNCYQQLEAGCFGHYVDRYTDQFQFDRHVKSNHRKPREHPQEEEIQKFKKVFEAWQAARFKECAVNVKVSSAPAQLIAQEDLNRENTYSYTNRKSTSTRLYRSEFQLNGTDSPEFINRDTRRLLAERSRNAVKGAINRQVPVAVRNISRLSMSDYDGRSGDTWIDSKISCSDSFTNDLGKQNMSSRREPDEGRANDKDLSPRNLIRSLSAPVSGTSFGKLLLEDRHILNGAQITRKHEVVEKVTPNIKNPKKDKYNIREKVLSFRYSLTLRGRMFRRRVKSVKGSDQNVNNLLTSIRNRPTVMMSFCETHENHTEVPPSPASVCSSVQEELWRQADHLSPISSSDGHQLDDSEMSHAFREINSNLNELRRNLDQLEGAVPEETVHVEHLTEIEVDIEDQAEAYVRDLLVAAGLCDVSCSQSLLNWDPLGKPISSRVFEDVKKTYNESTKDYERFKKFEGDKINHKMILDLLNEVLPGLLTEQVNMSGNFGKAVVPVIKPLYGRKLLSHVWNIIRVHVHPPSDGSYYALDNVLTRDLMWSTWMHDDVDSLGRDIECQITGELIYEVANDICTRKCEERF